MNYSSNSPKEITRNVVTSLKISTVLHMLDVNVKKVAADFRQ